MIEPIGFDETDDEYTARLEAEIERIGAQLASARKALEPFAAIEVPDTCRDRLSIMGIDRLIAGRLTVGHLRAAKAALTDENGT
jgi:hypothetical protein